MPDRRSPVHRFLVHAVLAGYVRVRHREGVAPADARHFASHPEEYLLNERDLRRLLDRLEDARHRIAPRTIPARFLN
jgi:hypothetical protein